MTSRTSERCVSSAIRYFLFKAFNCSQIQWGTLAPPSMQTLLACQILYGCQVKKHVAVKTIVSIEATYSISSSNGNDFLFVV